MISTLDLDVAQNNTTPANVPLGSMVVTSTPISVTDKESLIKLLECCVCAKLLVPPVVLCAGGHSVCSNCFSKLGSCPKCSECFTTTRNLLAEALIQKFASKCPYSKEGCSKILSANEWGLHQSSCVFRHVECSLKGIKSCTNTMICYSKYFKHLKTVHGVTGVSGTVIKVQQNSDKLRAALETGVPWELWPLHYLEAYDNIFLTGTEIQEGKIFWWISIVGTVPEANNFIGKILIENEVLATELSWSGPVVSFRWKPTQVIQTGCLAATKDNFRLFTQEIKNPDSAESSMCWNMTFSVCKRELKPQGSAMGSNRANSVVGSMDSLNLNSKQ